MIPLRDSRTTKAFAWATWGLVALNAAAFAWELRQGAGLESALARLALSPREALSAAPWIEIAWRPFRVGAALFLHGGWIHLLGNLAFLAVFGDDVESRLRGKRFLLLYFGSGFVASAAEIAVNPRSPLPLIGASGAIAGVLGAFLVLFPKAKLQGVLPLGCILLPMRSRAFLFLPFWFLLQLYGALAAPPGSAVGGVAWYAHLAGFAAGPVFLFFLRRR